MQDDDFEGRIISRRRWLLAATGSLGWLLLGSRPTFAIPSQAGETHRSTLSSIRP